MLTQHLNMQTQDQGETFLTPWNLPFPAVCTCQSLVPAYFVTRDPVPLFQWQQQLVILQEREWSKQSICCIAPLLWTRKREGRFGTRRTTEEDRGITCVTACSFTLFGQNPITTETAAFTLV